MQLGTLHPTRTVAREPKPPSRLGNGGTVAVRRPHVGVPSLRTVLPFEIGRVSRLDGEYSSRKRHQAVRDSTALWPSGTGGVMGCHLLIGHEAHGRHAPRRQKANRKSLKTASWQRSRGAESGRNERPLARRPPGRAAKPRATNPVPPPSDNVVPVAQVTNGVETEGLRQPVEDVDVHVLAPLRNVPVWRHKARGMNKKPVHPRTPGQKPQAVIYARVSSKEQEKVPDVSPRVDVHDAIFTRI